MKSVHPLLGSPWIGILLLLLVVFTAEATIMFVLPWFMPTTNSPQFGAFVDAALLTLLLVPILWWLFFRPLRYRPQSTAPVAHSEISIGQALGEYKVLAHLGSGGMGEVFKAVHVRMKRIVAVKLLPLNVSRNEDAIRRFEREAEAMARLQHPNIVIAHDATEATVGRHFLVMEYIEGCDLSSLVKTSGRLTTENAVECIVQAAQGLAYAHSCGVVHRDVKPANLMLDTTGTIKVLDLGLALLEHPAVAMNTLTQSGQMMGTADFMAPEQAYNSRQIDARADIYSLGCSLYYLITANLIYESETLVHKIMAHQSQPVPLLGNPQTAAAKSLNAIFQKMVAKQPEDRFQSMTELLDELASWKSSNHLDNTRRPNPSIQLAELALAAVDRRIKIQPDVLSNINGNEQTASFQPSPTTATEESLSFDGKIVEPQKRW